MSTHVTVPDTPIVLVYAIVDKYSKIEFFLKHSSCGGCMYSLTKSEAEYKEIKDSKDREIAILRDELTTLHSKYVQYVCEC